MRGLPLSERKIDLDRLCRAIKGARLTRVEAFPDGNILFDYCNQFGFEGPPAGSTEPVIVNEGIPIVTTAMHLGDVRHWFACPSCRRRCRVIYGGARFRCRLCYGAKYESQYQRQAHTICDIRRSMRRRLEERGGVEWPFGHDDGFPPKPPRMHWQTYVG